MLKKVKIENFAIFNGKILVGITKCIYVCGILFEVQ